MKKLQKKTSKNKQEVSRDFASVIHQLHVLENPQNIAGMARVGITGKHVLGISIVTLRNIAKEIGKDHSLALQLWESGIHEAQILAAYVDVPTEVTPEQMDVWVSDFASWDVCDQVCGNLFDRTPYGYLKAKEWAKDDREFVKRAGFVLMTQLAVHDKQASDEAFLAFFPLIRAAADDNRNFVRKAVNWAIRQIGKRNKTLLPQAISLAEELEKRESKASRWIAKDALRELRARLI